MTATATRWWVRRAARWLARIDSVKGQLSMASLVVTAFSTFSIMLQGFGLGRFVPYLGVAGVLVIVGYAYLFSEGGVWNQVSRDRQDLSSNFAGPNARITSELLARGIVAGFDGDELDDAQLRAVRSELDAAFQSYRDGVDLTQHE